MEFVDLGIDFIIEYVLVFGHTALKKIHKHVEEIFMHVPAEVSVICMKIAGLGADVVGGCDFVFQTYSF